MILDEEKKFQLALAITTGILSNSNTKFIDPSTNEEYRPGLDSRTAQDGIYCFQRVLQDLLDGSNDSDSLI